MSEWGDLVNKLHKKMKEEPDNWTQIRTSIKQMLLQQVEAYKAQGAEDHEAVAATLDAMESIGYHYPRLFEIWIIDLYPEVFDVFEEDDDAS